MASTQKTYALILGIVLLLVGILGFFSNPIVGMDGYFTTNMYQNILHVVVGLIGIYCGTKTMGKGFNMWTGWIALIVGILGFVPVASDQLASLLNINSAISILHVVIGIVSLAVYYMAEKM